MADELHFGLEYDPYGFVNDATAGPRRKVLALSTNFDMAVGALSSYMSGGVLGRSCLVAGARGSGKTTLIDRAIDEVKRLPNPDRIAIRVRLHGPSLLNPPPPILTQDDPTLADRVQEHVLKTLVINLYQTAAEEVANAFEDYMKYRRKEGSELAAQLRLTLDGAPSAATLRFFWDRAGALPGGVLFPQLWPPPSYRQAEKAQFTIEQGVSEIVALATAAEAYRSCAGQYKQEKKDEKSVGDKAEAKTEISASGKEFSKALTGLASGVAAGATAAVLTTDRPTIALAGAITALASMATLSYTRTRSRETTSKEEVTFLPDTSVSALVHRVLLLLRRLRQAGMVPVFVIDELDKVENPIKPLNDLTSSLKFLFADEGFFCFLTDRTYFAEIGRLNREHANTRIRTIYTNQMLVRYDTSAICEFLQKVIRPYGATDDIKSDLEADAEAFRYILICRSRMLLFELSRDLAGFSGTDGKLKVAFKAPRENLGHQFHLSVQLAIELVLTNEFVANRISRDANFAQTLYDALYYPVNLWYADERMVDCSLSALIDGIGSFTGEPIDLEAPDQDFLRTQVKAMLELVADLPHLEERLRTAFGSKRLQAADEILGRLLDAIPKEVRLLKVVTGKEDVYQWDYNRSGIPYEASAIQDIQYNRALWNAYLTINAMVESVAEVISRRPTVEQILSGLSAAESVIESIAGLSYQ